MSNEIEKVESDLTPQDREIVAKFTDAGRPGISAAKPEVVRYALQLYLDNNNMNYISQKTGLKKDILLYLSDKNNWYQVKKDTYANLATTLTTRLQAAKLQGLDYLTEIAGASRQYFQEKIDLFKKTNDPTVLESLDPNVVKNYHKTLELLFKLSEEQGDKDKGPLVGINIPEGATIQQNNDNTLTVTSNDPSSQKTALSTLAALNRLREEIEEQNKKKEK